MKNFIFAIIAILVFVAFYAFNNFKANFEDKANSIQFYKGNFNEALQLAKIKNNHLFSGDYAIWFGTCKRLKSNIFSYQIVEKCCNANFINFVFNGEGSEGAILANQYNIKSHSSLFLINNTANIVLPLSGYFNPAELLEVDKSISK